MPRLHTFEIPLTQGKIAIVDIEDREKVEGIKWHYTCGYARADTKHGRVYMHQLINNTPTGILTDHINTNGLDNRKVNLRNATRAENAHNSRKNKNSFSGYKGVSYVKKNDKWRARITVNWQEIHLGTFNTEVEAHGKYIEAAKHYHGEFARAI